MTAVETISRPWRLHTFVVFIVATLVAAWAVGPYLVGTYHDDGVYVLLARAIANGHGFHYTQFASEPAATHYPPLYPLLLAVVWKLDPSFPGNVAALVRVNALLVGMAAAGWCVYATRRLSWSIWYAAAGALFSTLALPTLTLASALLSETLFLALLWPVCIFCERALASSSTTDAAIAGVSIGLLMLVRTHAVALAAACILTFAMRRRFRVAAIVGGAALIVQLPWILWSATATPNLPAPLRGAYGSYLSWFSEGAREGGMTFVLATAMRNAREGWLFAMDRIAAGLPSALQLFAMVCILLFATYGAWAERRRSSVVPLFLALYFGIVLIWPYTPWRFIWAVWPACVMLALHGVRALWIQRGWRRTLSATCAALPLVCVLRVELHAYATRAWRNPSTRAASEIFPALRWAHEHVASNETVLSEGEPVLALYGGLRAAPPVAFTATEYLRPPAPADNVARQLDMIRSVPARYVILLHPRQINAAMSMTSGTPRFTRIATLSNGVVFEVNR